MASIERVLITGGAGFIGSHLAAAWCDLGAKVRILDSLRSGRRQNIEELACEFLQESVEDLAAVRAAMVGVDVVHHLAAVVSVPESMENPQQTEAINVLGTLNVLTAAREAGVQKVVFSSTCAVYGMAERPLHAESDLPEPVSPYAISKLAGEHYMNLYSTAFGVGTVSLRYFNVFGPRQDPKSPYAAAVAIFADRARNGEPLVIYGDGQQTRDFVYVEDIVAANLVAAERGSGVYNVACGNRVTIRDLADAILDLTGSSSRIIHEAPRAGDVRHSRGDASRLRSLGWAPKVSLGEGLRRTIKRELG